MEQIKSKYFFCYDYILKTFLSQEGHKYITHARSATTGREFWLFEKSEGLQKSIDSFITLRKKHEY